MSVNTVQPKYHMEEEEEEGERKVKMEAKETGKEKEKGDDRSEMDLVEFSEKVSISARACSDADEDDEVVVLGTNGPVALRDFPHPRHLCANFPFQSTPHQKCCSQCYCVSCEVVAPCSNWEGQGRDAHCHIVSKKCRQKLETATPTENDKKTIFIIEELNNSGL